MTTHASAAPGSVGAETPMMDTLKSILVDLGIAEELIHERAFLRKDLELDSAEAVEVALELKRRLGVKVELGSRKEMTLAEVCAAVEDARRAASRT